MAETKKGVRAAQVSYEEGFNLVRSYEDQKVSNMLAEYMCRIESYAFEHVDNYTQVTVTMSFPDNGDQHEIRSLAWFVIKAMHPSLYKEQILVLKVVDTWQVYIQWKIYTTVRTLAQIRSKRSS